MRFKLLYNIAILTSMLTSCNSIDVNRLGYIKGSGDISTVYTVTNDSIKISYSYKRFLRFLYADTLWKNILNKNQIPAVNKEIEIEELASRLDSLIANKNLPHSSYYWCREYMDSELSKKRFSAVNMVNGKRYHFFLIRTNYINNGEGLNKYWKDYITRGGRIHHKQYMTIHY